MWKALRHLPDQLRQTALSVLENNSLMRESVMVGIQKMRSDLGYNRSSALEKLMIEQVLTLWVQAYVVGLKLENATSGSHSIQNGIYLERRYHGAQARLTRALESLARVRSLLAGMNVQINIAEKQVNVTSA